MNHFHPTFEFTFQHSIQQMSFLDMKIHIRADQKPSTTLVRKRDLYFSTQTTHSSAKKASFFDKSTDAISLLQMKTYYKRN